ncbi:MAG: TetR/AcrR family transcriptional regulator [Ferrovibrio sp.]
MSSQKASARRKPSAAVAKPAAPEAKAPSRQRGRERVAALLAAGAAVFADKGFDAATMTEIAARAGASIGSLYQFFPTKAAVADALLEQYMAGVHAHLDGIAAVAATQPLPDLAKALCHALATTRSANPAFVALLDSGNIDPATIGAIRKEMRQRVAAILQRRAPALPAAELAAVAAAVLQMMKSAAALQADTALPGRPAALAELVQMLQAYLQMRLGG